MFYFLLFFINLVIYYQIDFINQKFNIYDHPDKKRKMQKKPVSVSGGLILYLNSIFIFSFIYFQSKNDSIFFINSYEFFLNLLFISALWIIGLFDDKIELKAFTKIILMLLVIIIFIFLSDYGLVKVFYFSEDLNVKLGNLYFLFTVFCIFTLTLTLNMFDGIDGQSLILYIFLSAYLFFFHNISFSSYILIPLVVTLILNLKQKIYLGDNGVMLFAGIISIILIKYNFLQPNQIFADEIILILLIPALDLIRLVIYRLYLKRSPLKADNLHIHHLANKFLSKKNYIILSIIYYFSLFSLLAVNIKFYNLIIIFTFLYLIFLIFFFKKMKTYKEKN